MGSSYLLHFIEDLQRNGRFTFTLDELRKNLDKSDIALQRSLARLTRAKKITSVRPGFYLIVPIEYSRSGTLPPIMFIDDLMGNLKRKYYVGLLSAAQLHGSAHHQPQEFYTVVQRPSLRPIKKNGIKMNFVVKGNFIEAGIIKKKTSTGYVNVSNPEMTILDLVSYEKRAGGLNRIVAIMEGLKNELHPGALLKVCSETRKTSVLQRLGYLLEMIGANELSPVIREVLSKRKTFPVFLSRNREMGSYATGNDWKVMVNMEIDLEF